MQPNVSTATGVQIPLRKSALELELTERFGGGDVYAREHAGDAPGGDELEFIMSDDSVDRMDDVIQQNWVLKFFKAHPIALFNHNPNNIIGKWANVRVEGNRLLGRLELATADTSELVATVRKLVAQKILRAVSVGFRSIEKEPLNKDASEFWGPFRFLKSELLECSLVAVPANPNALSTAKSLGLPPAITSQIFRKPANEDPRYAPAPPASLPKATPRNIGATMTHAQRIEEMRNVVNQRRDRLSFLQNEDVLSPSDQTEFAALPGSLEEAVRTLKTYEDAERAQALAASLTQAGLVPAASPNAPAIIVPRAQKVSRPFDHLVRSFVITGMAYHLKKHPEEMLRDLYGGDPETGAVLRAAHPPAMTTQTNWAAELVQTTFADFLDLLMPDFIYPQLQRFGLGLSFGRFGKISIPSRTTANTLAGDFVGEGAPIPVREAAFTTAILQPKKLAVITTFTREMSLHSIPAIEGIVRQAILDDTGKILDTRLLDNVAGTAVRPPGLLNTVTPITATAITGGALAAFITDMSNLVSAFFTANAGRKIVLIMNKADAMRAGLLTTTTGDFVFAAQDEIRSKFGIEAIITSTSVTPKTVIAVDAADFVSATGDEPQFDISNQATLHMDDAPAPISATGSPNVVAAPIRSLWQTDTIGVRMIADLSWAMRRTGMVQTVQNVTW